MLQCFQCCERWDPHAGVERKTEGLHADRPVGRADGRISSPQCSIIYLVTDGCVHILLQGREITVRENEGAFVNSGVLHGMESVGADAAVLQVTFPPEYVTGAEDPRLTARYADPIVKARERDCLLLRGSGWANDICDRLQLLPSVLSARGRAMSCARTSSSRRSG